MFSQTLNAQFEGLVKNPVYGKFCFISDKNNMWDLYLTLPKCLSQTYSSRIWQDSNLQRKMPTDFEAET